MKPSRFRLILIFVLYLIFSLDCLSQVDTLSQKLTKLTLIDGSEFIGKIIEEDSARISFETIAGVSMSVPKDKIKSRTQLLGYAGGLTYYRPDPNHTRLFFAPTARPLKSGQGYFSAYQIFFPFIAVGIADFMTLAGGISLLPGAEDQLLYFAPKVTPVVVDKLSVSGGVLYVNSTSADFKGLGILYGVSSYGDEKASWTAGAGWGFYGSEINNKPIILVGGDLRVSNSIKLITENWFPVDSKYSLLSFGVRFFGESLAADLGFIYPMGVEIKGFPFLPWLGFAYNFRI